MNYVLHHQHLTWDLNEYWTHSIDHSRAHLLCFFPSVQQVGEMLKISCNIENQGCQQDSGMNATFFWGAGGCGWGGGEGSGEEGT